MLLGTATNTLECLWALHITFCGNNWKRLTGHCFTLMSQGAYLPVTTVTIVLAGVIQETQKEGELKALRQDGIEKLIDTLTAKCSMNVLQNGNAYFTYSFHLNDEI